MPERTSLGNLNRQQRTSTSPRIETIQSNSKDGASSQRCETKQQRVRAQGLLAFERETSMTPYGFRTMRLHPSTDTSEKLKKYRPRPKTAIGLSFAHLNTKDMKSSNGGKYLAASLSAMNLNERPSSSRSVIFNTRNQKCTPPNMYLHDDLREVTRSRNGRHSRSSSDTSPATLSQCTSSAELEMQSPHSDIAYRFGKAVQRPKFVQKNRFLNHNDLTMGQKQYIWGIARVYSVDHLKKLKQRLYQNTLNYEYSKRIMTKNLNDKQRIKLMKEYQMYEEFINRFTSGLPVSSFKRCYEKRDEEKPHRHSCIPWSEAESEPRILADRIILKDRISTRRTPSQNSEYDLDRPSSYSERSYSPQSLTEGQSTDSEGEAGSTSGSEDQDLTSDIGSERNGEIEVLAPAEKVEEQLHHSAQPLAFDQDPAITEPSDNYL